MRIFAAPPAVKYPVFVSSAYRLSAAREVVVGEKLSESERPELTSASRLIQIASLFQRLKKE